MKNKCLTHNREFFSWKENILLKTIWRSKKKKSNLVYYWKAVAEFRVRMLAFLYTGQGEVSQIPCHFCWKSHSLQFFAAFWQVDHYPIPESSVKPSIVQREAPKPCLARKYKSHISNTSSPWSSLPTSLGNQLINEWDSVGPFCLFHTQIWDVSYEMWPCIHYLNTLIQIFLVFSNSYS